MSLTQKAYARIREAILNGELPPGTPLSRRRLAEELSISTIPIAEALKRLEAEGFVESRPRAGTRVKIPTAEEIRGKYILREALETHSARLFSELATRAERQELLRRARRLDGLPGSGSGATPAQRVRFEKAHTGFHAHIAKVTRCKELMEAIEQSRVLLFNWLFSHAAGWEPLPSHWHEDLATSLASGDPNCAAEAMRKHVRFRMDAVMQCFGAISEAANGQTRIQRGPRRRPRASLDASTERPGRVARR